MILIPRKRLDIDWTDLFYGLGSCLWPPCRQQIQARLDAAWSSRSSFENQASLVCLSVRSGFDALLHTLNFPMGSEILVSAMTIRGMTQVIEAHHLSPVPVDLEIEQLTVGAASLAQCVTPRTKAILVAHLFGSRMPMEPILQFARAHHLLVFEDCAQAYGGAGYGGHPQSDVSLFSFGPIKTATALAGGILNFRDRALRDAVSQHQNQWPIQSRLQFGLRIGKYMLLVLLSQRWVYSLFVAGCHCFKANHDRVVASSVRGFPGDRLLMQIRQRPSTPLLVLLTRRLRQFDQCQIADRQALAEKAIALMPGLRRPGDRALHHTHWVFPILHEQPEQLMMYLWQQGFDATQGGSSLYVVPPPPTHPDMRAVAAEQAFQQLLYLPIYVGVSPQEIARLAQAVKAFDSTRSRGRQAPMISR